MPLICHSFGSSPQSWTEVFATALLFCTCWTNSKEQMKIHIPYTSFLTTKNVAHEHYLQAGVPTSFLKRITQVFTDLRYYRFDARAMLQSRGVNTYTNMWEILATLFRELQLSLNNYYFSTNLFAGYFNKYLTIKPNISTKRAPPKYKMLRTFT